MTDGFGMFLRVTPKGSNYWQMAYRIEGKKKIFSIGVYPAVSLAEARHRRDEAEKLLASGIDPSAKNRLTTKVFRKSVTIPALSKPWLKNGLLLKPHGQKIISAQSGLVLKLTSFLISATKISVS